MTKHKTIDSENAVKQKQSMLDISRKIVELVTSMVSLMDADEIKKGPFNEGALVLGSIVFAVGAVAISMRSDPKIVGMLVEASIAELSQHLDEATMAVATGKKDLPN